MLFTLVRLVVAATAASATASPQLHTKIRAADSPACVNGVAASSGATFPIEDYTQIVPTAQSDSYTINQTWYNSHYISDHYIGGKRGDDGYSAFKCQYNCNALGSSCASFFVYWFNLGTQEEQAKCVLFNATIDQSNYVAAGAGTAVAGGFDRLCTKK
ncbi:hypothetical protein B0T17DRAFT_612555 [Bombardia bombarda]|uniref:Apple domain-containing protein n=1 Tax=Bombardia bombarda TaxID=252184 RepID=A0AA40CFS5_9PEZI|nr:hypothetical protein B0T17DRAFT_612555 [Bombardia bombarda]